MKKMYPHNGRGAIGQLGFTLIELMVVLAILGILGMVVGVYINTADTKLRSFAFNLGSRVKQAKFEAIKDGSDVYMDFDSNGDNTPENKFSIWVDRNKNGSYDAPVPPDENDGNKVAADEAFPAGVEIYDASDSAITGGPHDPSGPEASALIDNGVYDATTNDKRIRFTPGGVAENAWIYIYSPRTSATGKEVAAGPWAICINKVGRIRLAEWSNGTWKIQ